MKKIAMMLLGCSLFAEERLKCEDHLGTLISRNGVLICEFKAVTMGRIDIYECGNEEFETGKCKKGSCLEWRTQGDAGKPDSYCGWRNIY